MYTIASIKRESDVEFGESSLGYTGKDGGQLALFQNSKNKKPIKKKKIYQLGTYIPDARTDKN